MAWIESHQSLATHRKTMALQRLLRISTPRAVGHLHLLWWWALDNAPDGNIEGIDAKDIARAAQWTGNAEKFLTALKLAGFVDEKPSTFHDWADYAGRLVQRREANKQRMRVQRAMHVQSTLHARAGATVPNPTIPNSTVPEPPCNPPKDGAAATAYEENIGMLTNFVSDELRDAVKEYTELWVVDAIKEAAESNVRNWKYVAAILGRWKSQGRGDGARGTKKQVDPDKYTRGKYANMMARSHEDIERIHGDGVVVEERP